MGHDMSEQQASTPMNPATPPTSNLPPTVGATPPTVILPPHMLPVLPKKPTVWPTVLGIIATVVGGLGVLIYGCGSVIGPVMSNAMSTAVQQSGSNNSMFEAQMRIQSQYMWWQIGSGVFAMGLSTLLLCTGIGLMRRRPWTRTSALTWAVLRMLHAILATVIGFRMSDVMFEAMQQAMQEAMQQQQSARGAGPAMPAMPFNFFGLMRSLGYAGAVVSLLWYWAMPIFTLVWFNRRTIKTEVASWRVARERT